MAIHIMTDSVSDLPRSLQRDLNITVVPLTVTIDGESYLDGEELGSDAFFEKLKKAPGLPKTAQVSPGAFATAIENALHLHDEVLVITMASSMSGTYQAACSAVEILETSRVRVIDSKCVTFGLGLIAMKAAELAAEGLEMDKLVQAVELLIQHHRSYFIVDTLSYLTKGGRLTRAEGFVGELLNIKPILTIEEGKLVPVSKARGRKKAMAWLLDQLDKEAVDFSNCTVGLFHAVDRSYLELFEKTFTDRFSPAGVVHSEVGAVVGTHSGPGCIAIAYIPNTVITMSRQQ